MKPQGEFIGILYDDGSVNGEVNTFIYIFIDTETLLSADLMNYTSVLV